MKLSEITGIACGFGHFPLHKWFLVKETIWGQHLTKGVINLLATSDPKKIQTFDNSTINLGQLSAHFQLNSNITIAISVPALVIFIAAVIVAIFVIVIYIMLCLQRRHVSQLIEIFDLLKCNEMLRSPEIFFEILFLKSIFEIFWIFQFITRMKIKESKCASLGIISLVFEIFTPYRLTNERWNVNWTEFLWINVIFYLTFYLSWLCL